MNGDIFIDIDFVEVASFSNSVKAPVLVTSYMEDLKDYGAIEFNNEKKLTSFLEKKSSKNGHAYAGVSLLSDKQFSGRDLDSSFSIEEEILNDLRNNYYIYENESDFLDIGTPERIKLAKERL